MISFPDKKFNIKMFPKVSKIELFARPDWTDYGWGWDFWGSEV